jgi:hypothetical protein
MCVAASRRVGSTAIGRQFLYKSDDFVQVSDVSVQVVRDVRGQKVKPDGLMFDADGIAGIICWAGAPRR